MAQNLKRLRTARHLSLRELSARLEDTQPINPDGLNRAEKGTRQVSADELTALAAVLGVNPSALLLPIDAHGDVEISGAGKVPADAAWDWMDGKGPLQRDVDGEAEVSFQELARPRERRRFNYQTWAGRRRVGQIYDQVEGAEVIRTPDGDVLEVRLPGGGRLFRVGESDGG